MPLPGDTLGGYRLLMPVGLGGMGRVWAARRLGSPTSELVAIKTLLEQLSHDGEFERVFVDEARLASRIVHPNVCAIHEFGREGDIAYLAMEWVDGGTLHDLLAASPLGRLEPVIAAEIGAAVCAGLHAAHQLLDADGNPMQVVHRDVSPQNILISSDGQVKISDFGVARARGQLHRPTRTGELKGKLSYMAPEQLTSRDFDHRVDIFALGCVLYQATTGKRPFGGDEALETMYRLLETNCEPPSTIIADYPQELETILLTALAKDLDQRYPTAKAFESALLGFLAARDRRVDGGGIAQVVRTTLGNAIRRRAQELEISGISSAPRSLERLRTNPILRADAASRDRLDSSSQLDADLRTTANRAWQNSLFPASRFPRGSLIDWGIWSLFLVTTLVMVALLSWRTRSSAHPFAPIDAARIAAIDPSSRVSIEIETEPAGAQLSLDGNVAQSSPQRFDGLRSDATHVLEASLAGHQTERRTFTFEQSQRLVIRLKPDVASTNAPSPAARERLRRGPKLAPSAVPQPTAAPEPTPPKPRRPKRSLDPENPF